MKLLTAFALVGLVVASPLAFAQTKPSSDQKAGDCSVNVNGNGNTASLVCEGIDATLAKQIQEILHGTKQNESATKDISAKLDRIVDYIDHSLSFVELDIVTLLKDYSTLQAGAGLKFNASYVQHGPEPLHDVYGFTSTLFIEDPKGDADSIARSMFQQSLDKFKAERASANIKGADLGIGQAQWTTVSFPFSDQSGVDAVLDGRIRLYIFGWETWTDMEDRTSDKVFCRWLQTPHSITLLPEDVIWHSCIF
jgi:hypothetical protein